MKINKETRQRLKEISNHIKMTKNSFMLILKDLNIKNMASNKGEPLDNHHFKQLILSDIHDIKFIRDELNEALANIESIYNSESELMER
jgi:hypothetical protein